MASPLPLEQALSVAWPSDRWTDRGVLVAVSGGADSVALLRALVALKGNAGRGRLTVAHFNHGWRGAESLADQRFVVELCETLKVACEVGAAPDESPSPADGLEAAARDLRYQFLLRTAERLGARYLVTAHTADDQAETVLHHVLRGTGLAGLAGIPQARVLSDAVTLYRPLLGQTRRQVLDYLAALNQPYCEDATNRLTDFTRNRIRHELLPLLERDYYPGVAQSLVRLGAVANDAQRLIQRLAEELLDRSLLEAGAARAVVNCGPLVDSDRHLVRETLVALWRRQRWPLQSMGYEQWNLLADLAMGRASQPRNRHTLPGGIAVERVGDQLWLSPSVGSR